MSNLTGVSTKFWFLTSLRLLPDQSVVLSDRCCYLSFASLGRTRLATSNLAGSKERYEITNSLLKSGRCGVQRSC